MAKGKKTAIARASENARTFSDEVRRVTESLNAFNAYSPTIDLLRNITERNMLMQGMHRPFAELIHQENAFQRLVDSSFGSQALLVRERMLDYEKQFILPNYATLISEQAATIGNIIEQYHSTTDQIHRMIYSMSKPWLRIDHPSSSVAGIVKIQGISCMLGSMSGFHSDVVSALRMDFGDWTNVVNFPDPATITIAQHEAFYVDRGFNSDLVDFTPATFEEIINISGLNQNPPSLEEQYGHPIPPAEGEESEEEMRAKQFYGWLWALETKMRKFIDEKMSEAFGKGWPRHRLPNGYYQRWEVKKNTAERNGGATMPLIAYADFTDYPLIICRADNWREVFAAHFEGQDNVRESFRRLDHIRIAIGHTRIITQTSELCFLVEARRLGSVINRRN